MRRIKSDTEITPTPPVEPEAQAPIDAGDDAPRIDLHATPNRKRAAVAETEQPIICSIVFALVTTGMKGKLDAVPLHEIPLLRRKLNLQEPAAEVPRVLAEWPEHHDRIRPQTQVLLRETYNRMVERYTVDKPGSQVGEQVNLVADFYGTGISQLRNAMQRLEHGYRQIVRELKKDEILSDEQLEELVAFADPDFDINGGGSGDIEYREFEPGIKGDGAVIPSR